MSFLSRPCLATLLRGLVLPAGLALGLSLPETGQAQVSPFRQAVAESVAGRADLAPSYRARGFAGPAR